MSKKSVLNSRLEKFYSPFYMLCVKHGIHIKPSNFLTSSTREAFINIIYENIPQIHTSIHPYLNSLFIHNAYYSAAIEENNYDEIQNEGLELCNCFEEILNSIFLEHIYICSELNMPKPTNIFYKLPSRWGVNLKT